MGDEAFGGYDTGADFWRDTAVNHGIDEAVLICGNYLEMNLKRELSNEERSFTTELFAAMCEAAADKTNLEKLIYPYTLGEAKERTEISCYRLSNRFNKECAQAVDKAISASCYKTHYYNLDLAVMKVVQDYGFERVNAVLAYHIQKFEYDGRFSKANKEWAAGVSFPADAFDCAYLNAHATLIDSVVNYARKLYLDLNAARFALPGREEHGEFVKGYEIKRAVMVDDNQGYAIAHNPNAVSPCVCWQFYIKEGKRDYDLGVYGEKKDAINAYNARVFAALN